MCPPTSKRKTVKGEIVAQTRYDFPDAETVTTFTQTLFLTVQSDPGAEQEWQRFSCNDTVRLTSPDFLKSLQQLFKDKPAGQYLVKVESELSLTTLDFEPKPGSEHELEEQSSAAYYASHATQDVCLRTAGQTEADAVSPWALEPRQAKTGASDPDAEFELAPEFDAEQRF